MLEKKETGNISAGIETSDELGKKTMSEISSLREELAAIRDLLGRGHSLHQALAEYRYLPGNMENPIRWGFIGVWGKNGSNSSHSIHTTSEDNYFDDPQASDENVAAFAAAFTNPNTIKICKHLFRNGGRSREEIKGKCSLSDAELDAAVEPLLEWYFAKWKDGNLETGGAGINGQGINYVVTLISMVKVAVDNKAHGGHSELYP